MALGAVSLEDKYTLQSGRVYLSGAQALVRLLILQRQRDLAAGLNIAGFITGYRGSPLGSLDLELWRAGRRLITEYEALIEEIINRLDQDNHALAVEIAGLPERIRGYGHVKQAAVSAVKQCEADLMKSFRDPSPTASAAE